MYRTPQYYASKKTTLYDLLPLYDGSVDAIIKDRNGKTVAHLKVKDMKMRPNFYLFDIPVINRDFSAKSMVLTVELDYAERTASAV